LRSAIKAIRASLSSRLYSRFRNDARNVLHEMIRIHTR
jgi:hypothetical protein